MKNIYLFSGLGTDHRAFQFLDLSDYQLTYVEWILPTKNESLESYAKRLSEQVISEKPIFIGLSFGGMIAVEVAKYIEPEKIILISSLKSGSEIPFYFRLTALLHLHKTMPSRFLKRPNRILFWFFGAYNEKEKTLLTSFMQDVNPKFLKWAIDKIIHWRNTVEPKNLTHIHGTSDRILPHRNIRNLTAINNGGHFMIINKAKEINKIIQEVL